MALSSFGGIYIIPIKLLKGVCVIPAYTHPMNAPIIVHPIVQLMADIMNYFSVSLYKDQFTKTHEDSYAILNSIYDTVSLKPSIPPSLNDSQQFYNNIVSLAGVTYTDDPDYYTYKRTLRKYIIELTSLGCEVGRER
jgi:hypothetical protein